ncbi:MAG: hypothetical protein OEV99_08635 [Nitrospira sp.]|nr:hypothetical protein [Nitrospira sp.]MDH4369901.1 hypothetical protein [Nitrospira sp.]MDH5497359.1 hypothetical protein [Nitrospira sp.]
MDKIRVLLANQPLMMPDAVRQLVEEQADLELVGDCREAMHILQETSRATSDAVIRIHEGCEESGLCSQL